MLYSKKICLLITATVLSVSTLQVFAADPTVDELLDLILNDTGAIVSSQPVQSIQPQPVATPTTTSSLPVPTTLPLPTTDEEFTSALNWMYTNGLTQFSTPSTYLPNNNITREQAAKFFVVMQESILGGVPTVLNKSCSFSDSGFDPTLRQFVDKACAYGILIGNNGSFRPTARISRPEFVTALVRMLEGARRDETGNPRWLEYYQQARDRGITKERNANAFDVPTTRYEAALFLYRSLAIIKQLDIAPINTGDNTAPSIEQSDDTSTSNQPSIPAVSDPILQEAIYRMHDNGMTKYSSAELFRPFDTLQRQEAAKIFTLFRNTILQGEPTTDGISCAFDDLSQADQTLVKYIKEACRLQILRGSNNLFNPEGLLTKPQAVAILMRMLEGSQNETGANRWQLYYDRAVAIGMIEPSSPANFDKPISRYEVAKILYNSKVRYDLIKNLNNNYETNKLIYPVPNTQSTGSTTGEIIGLVSINTQALSRTDITSFVVDLFGNQYKIKREATQKYLANDYVWYGTMMTIDETEEVGSVAFTMSNGVIIDGVLRPYSIEGANYFLRPSEQQPYYEMRRVLKK